MNKHCVCASVALASWIAVTAEAQLPAGGRAPRVETVAPGVTMVMDDNGNWAGSSMGTTHQHQPNYQAMKIIGLAGLPADALKRTKEARLRVYFAIQDYSWKDGGKPNALDESFEVVVNGKAHTFRTDGGFVAKATQTEPIRWVWQEFPIPAGELTHGENRFIFKKAEGPKYDDYIYVGIDDTASHGNSYMSKDSGATWSNQSLNAIGATGEYMVRLMLIEKELQAQAEWKLGEGGGLTDPARIIGYAGAESALTDARGATLNGTQSRLGVELDTNLLDRMARITVSVQTNDEPRLEWLDNNDKPLKAETKRTGDYLESTPLPSRFRPAQVVVKGTDKAALIRSVKVAGTLAYLPEPVINIRPKISAPQGKAADRTASCRMGEKDIILENAHLRCRFEKGTHLRLASLYNEHAAIEMAPNPAASPLFLVETGEKRHTGSGDFICRSVKALGEGQHGFTADLALPGTPLAARMTVSIDAEAMRWKLTVANEGNAPDVGGAPADFKLAFPALGGLRMSENSAEDYYYFPMGGGIIADTPAVIRRGYGDHAALYQVMDIFSPARGAGLLVRTDDADGGYKVLALRKTVPGRPEINEDRTSTPTTDEYKWKNTLDAVPGVSLAYEYLRRTREPGKTFTPAEAVFETHAGDWREAMKRYTAWAYKAWKFRPYPSRLDEVVNMIAAGWAQGILFKDGQYRTDIIKTETNCIELMSWWDWSPLGHYSTPFDKLKEALGEALYKRWTPYFVKDPVTGQMMFNNNPGDYDGYNQQFGGLPAFRKAVQTYKDMGTLVTLYTDPIRCDDNTKLGRAHGKDWGVVKADGTPSANYQQWDMCHDVAEYRQWVADTMKRVMRETGADGLRLDEYGHRGWACFSKLHQHTYAEPGCTEWQRAITETCRLVHAAMDEVDPKLVLTTEHPGYDFQLPYLEGCITYDLTVQASELRPLECNTQRFYFPECKAYELDHRGADPKHEKRFWNGVASFGSYYPAPMYAILRENNDVFRSRDCEPLVPTLVERVYANRFADGNKTIWTLYNARGYTVEAPMLEAAQDAKFHYFDLLNCKELPAANAAIALKIPRDRTACVARLPRAMTVKRQGEKLLITVAPQTATPTHIVIAAQDGKALAQTPAQIGENILELPKAEDGKPLPAACVKLMRNQYLTDATELPSS